jgi:BolA protein
VVAEAFEELALVKRHQLIYMLLGDIMEKIHALEIKAKSPSEV